jgi:tetratricopeptide (TPR) repeat protein
MGASPGLNLLQTYGTARIVAFLFCASTLFFVAAPALAQVPTRTQRSIRPPELNVQFHRAETAWKSGTSLLEAKARIDRVIRVLPNDLEARKLRAGIFLSMGQPDRAAIDARRAVLLGPDDGEAHLLLCEASVRTDRQVAALTALQHSAELLIDQPGLHIRLSRCAIALGRLDEAEAYARIALAGDDMNASAYLQLARVFIIVRQFQKCVTVLEKGLRLGLIQPSQIRNDSMLHVVADDGLLADFMDPR